MVNFGLQADKIEKVKKEVTRLICREMGSDIREIIMYGSCARGDYTEDSDIDIALLTGSGRMEAKNIIIFSWSGNTDGYEIFCYY